MRKSVKESNGCFFVSSCPRDPSVQFHDSSDPRKVRFSFELFKFLGGHDYVFIHCRVHVCDVNDLNSRCAKGCNEPTKRDQDKHGSRAQQRSDKSAKTVAQLNEKHVMKVVAPAREKATKLHVAQQSDKRAKNPVAQPNEKHVKKVVAPASEKATKFHAAAKKVAGKPASQPNARRAKAPLISDKKAQDHPKAPEMKAIKTAVHRIMKRTADGSRKRGVLGSADVSSKGPIILDIDGRKDFKREPRPKKVFAQSKGSGTERDVNDEDKRGKFYCLIIASP